MGVLKNVFQILAMLVLALILFQLMFGETTREFLSKNLDNLYKGRVEVVSDNYGKNISNLYEGIFNKAKTESKGL